MAERVLVFEKDTNFVRELQDGFGGFGAEVEVVRDADAGIARARAGGVKLVLVDVDAMEAAGEAFLVCKRFKSDDELAKIPFVIMGGAQHGDAFESHKKLKKRRADEYVQLPTSISALLAKVSGLAGWDSPPAVDSDADSEFEELDSIHVDDDIDAFADNAFDELMMDDSPGAGAGPVLTVQGPGGDPQLVAQLREEIVLASARAEQAEARAVSAEQQLQSAVARTSEADQRVLEEGQTRIRELERRLNESLQRTELAEKRLREAGRPSSPPNLVGVSSRDYLDLREQLNRKEKELLSLRDEVTQRDRQLLEASDRSLLLERTQAELHDGLVAAQRELEETQAKIVAYETDRETVNKRLEDLRGRLGRAEDKGKRLEGELDRLQAEHEGRVRELSAAHELAMAERERAVASELERLRAEQAELEASSRRALAEAQARQNELTALRATHERALAELSGAHEHALAEAQAAHGRALEEQTRAAEAAQARALGEAAQERARALDALAAELGGELDRRLGEAENARRAALSGLERELEARWAAERQGLQERHANEVQHLSGRLSEAESRGFALSERLEELERARQELERSLGAQIRTHQEELARRLEERDAAQNELSAARASIASLERSSGQLLDRVNALENELAQARDQIAHQGAKIALDQELLERVRKAMAIGMGLLEQQRQNVL